MPKTHRFDRARYRVEPGEPVNLDDLSTKAGDEFAKKSEAKRALEEDISMLSDAQALLWASGQYSVLILLQALDAAGKDGTIKHVMSGVNPQGCEVHSFKAPSDEELSHHFLWRPTRYLPARGRIGIFNRSYYEEVLVVRVHPKFLQPQRLPPGVNEDNIWQSRFEDINAFEHALSRNGTCVIKFFLHLSKAEQKERFFERLNNPEKNWKFSAADLRERGYWDDYMHAYQEMLAATSTEHAPWYVIPADNKWFTRACVADIIAARIEELDLQPPTVSPDQLEQLQVARRELENEPD